MIAAFFAVPKAIHPAPTPLKTAGSRRCLVSVQLSALSQSHSASCCLKPPSSPAWLLIHLIAILSAFQFG